ncbi:hypothetical protein CBER1_02768 [Lecanosticta acicola]|uniref:Glutamyl-tRNA amidotransferase complex subunit Gta3 domain-containing protein n=1 Tax=Lecanosticta acicola TaxID=111012 RepID=A0AAI8Z8A1_9PEZI|nr:hypothetical protein CBER1_02768 [Lecanosticta acicola]
MVALKAYQRAIGASRLYSRAYSHSAKGTSASKLDVDRLLSTPTWSVASLLPSEGSNLKPPEISSKQLHHLLRLSALPPPKDAEEEREMLSILSSQLHFVKDIQQVDTSGTEPLQSLRDETQEGEKEAELGLKTMKSALEEEEIRGKYHRRIRRRRQMSSESKDAVDWDVLGSAVRRAGRYFVVEGGKDR